MNDQTSDDHGARMMQGLYWWGLPTLFRCPYEADPGNCDIGLVGVPHSTGNGTTERDQHLGPRAVRHVSALGRRVHMKYRLDPWQAARIADLGDVPLPEANDNEACIQRITDFYKKIDAAGTRPVSIGGDHSITGGILQALGGPGTTLAGGRKVATLHFDAHTDTFATLKHFLGAKKSAAHWGAFLVEQGHVDPTRSVQIGIRGNPRSLDWLKPSYEYGYEVITMEDYRARGEADCMATIRERLGDMPVYITFDLDCLDPSVAPGVANIEAGCTGFMMDEAVRLIQSVRGLNVIGGDVACLIPTKDNPNQITSLVATSIMFEMVCLMADKAGAR